MTVFICQLSELDWKVSREIGIYGNREGRVNDKGEQVFFKNMGSKGEQIIQSIIEDLVGMQKGDLVFFHVLDTSEEESSVHGIYRISEEPFYNESIKLWTSSSFLVYPYRFCFEPHPEHIELCKYDSSILVSEFYKQIETRAIRSVLTLEREVQGAAHAVKTITSEDACEIEKLLYRDFSSRHAQTALNFKPAQMNKTPLISHVERVGEIEFAIKAIVAYRLGRRDSDFTKFIPACGNGTYDFLIESFIGQTLRRPTDIICIGESRPERLVTIIEAKTKIAEIRDLIQSLNYREWFRLRNIDKGSLKYRISLCLLAQKFKQDLANYVKVRNTILPSEEIILLKYVPTQNGKDSTFVIQALTDPAFLSTRKHLSVNSEALLSKIQSEPNSVYSILGKESPLKTIVEFESSEQRKLTLRKYYFREGKKIYLGNLVILLINGKCTLEDFVKFMKFISEEALKFQGDFMSVEPIIVAESFEPMPDFFIEKYNEIETLARKQPITAYIAFQS